MASASNPNRSTKVDCAESYFQITVCVKDWWLEMAEKELEGKRLAVAGFTSRENRAVREFHSAPILRRYDVFNLETVDGVCIIFEGSMNKARSEKNGFPSEVCDHFVFGFPPYWKIYAGCCFKGESPLTAAARSNPELLSLKACSRKQDKDPERVKKRATRQDKMDELMPSSSELDRAKNRKGKSASNSEKHTPQRVNLFPVKTQRKLSYESPAFSEKQNSNESFSLDRRSRSGRLLLPRLEFWRNQRAVYDSDRRIMGVNNLLLDQSSGGVNLNSKHRGKKRQLR